MTPDMSTREELEAVMDGRQPVHGAGGRIYYVRYNEDKEELEEIPGSVWDEDQIAKAKEMARSLRPKRSIGNDIGDVALATGKGVVSGAESVLNGYTLGGYGWLGNKLGLGVTQRANELQQAADASGVGKLNQVAQLLAELGGGAQGAGKSIYDFSKKGVSGLGKLLHSGWLSNTTLVPSILSGGVGAGIYSSFSNDFSSPGQAGQDAGQGMLISGVLGTAGKALPPLSRLISSQALTKGKRGGLVNVSADPESVKLLEKGINRSAAVAGEYLRKFPIAVDKLNNSVMDSFSRSLRHRVDVSRTASLQKDKYSRFMSDHAGDEVMNFAPTREQLAAYKPQSSFNPNKNYTREKADEILRERANKQGLSIYNDKLSYIPEATEKGFGIQHLLNKGKKPFVRTLNNTINNPDIRFSADGRDFVAKMYKNADMGKNFMDYVITENGDIITKYPTTYNHVANQIEKSAQNMSLSGRILSSSAGATYAPVLDKINVNIPLCPVVVNPDLPHVSSLYKGLTPQQAGQLDKAIQSGLSASHQAAGSLESMNNIRRELQNISGRRSAVMGEDLSEVQKRIDDVLGSTFKTRDRGYRKAKQMETAFNSGLAHEPNRMSAINGISGLSPLDKNAFAQGLFQRLSNLPSSGKNLASEALKYDQTLSGVLPKQGYQSLMEGLKRQSAQSDILSQLGSAAARRLQSPTSGRLFDNRLGSRALQQASHNLMDPSFIGVRDTWLMDNYPYILNYLSSLLPQQVDK